MNRLATALERFDELQDDTLLIRYLTNHSSDEILDDTDSLNIEVSYEDTMRLSAYALADLILEQI